ncbi:helix-turn-helix domain-containing protein [Anaerosporobacter faecicola]|uniref:helix-turn-helix domain-containing protein n=1 Tax=Anaerosporobacter faecicola TaxID=2718714 RepID=UPI00143A0E9D|nr:helix-turn-helix transcriptional regulator [Anaerosporobacter faecicola]
MSFGHNIQFLRKLHDGMTQEELAEIMQVSRQTVSKWELDLAYPEMDKVIDLCSFFSCSMDQLIREDLNTNNEAFSDIRIVTQEAFSYVKHIVISETPEDDAIASIKGWATQNNLVEPKIIGWDFPNLSQEQINVYHMHGYVAACMLPENFSSEQNQMEIYSQKEEKYAVITVTDPFLAPFQLIPNAYKTLERYLDVNNIPHMWRKDAINCFEYEYQKEGKCYMDIYILLAK